jgi:hypothetical protein
MSRKGAGSKPPSRSVPPSASASRTVRPQISDAICHWGSRSTSLPLTRDADPVTEPAATGSPSAGEPGSREAVDRTAHPISRKAPLPDGFHHPFRVAPDAGCWKRGSNVAVS